MDLVTDNLIGLSKKEVLVKQKKDGFNELQASKPKNVLAIIFGIIKEPMILLLIACGTIYLFLGDRQEAIMLIVSIFGVGGITFYQEKKTEKSLEALRNLSSPRAFVIRNGKRQRIPGKDVVTDDIIILSEGDRVPADAVVIESSNLSIDESLLTGESLAVSKIKCETENFSPKKPGGDNQYYVYAGSMIVKGYGIAKVISIGQDTEMGKIGKALQSVEIEKTLVQKEVSRFVKIFALVGLSLCIILVIVYGLTRGHWMQGFLAGITMAMGTMPEEFPITLTIFMTMGAWRLAQNKVLTRRNATIETLGSATVLCVDKTGTLTKNKMSIASIYTQDGHIDYNPKLTDKKIKDIIKYGVLASKKEPFDPMELAFVEAGRDLFEHEKYIHQDMELVKEYDLEKYSLSVTHVWDNSKDKFIVAAKGAPETILDLCHVPKKEKEILLEKVHHMAFQGYRVLGVAKGTYQSKQKLPENRHDFDFEFLGFVGLADPIRSEIPLAIKECYSAGIRVVMITGDYPSTAQNIANQIGLESFGGVLTGPELEELSPEALKVRMKNVNIFSRVVPEQKLLIVNAFKQMGEVVAMTGDGVNDAPALKSAHIGIAMGNRGTDVAREAAGIVLLDDNFSSIVKGVRLGRRIYNNLQKAMTYIFAVHFPLAGLSLIPVLLKWPLILLPVHIVFLELVIDPACTVAFESEPEEKNIMRRPPRRINEPIFSKKMLIISVLQGVIALFICLVAFKLCLDYGFSEQKARAFTFAVVIASNISLILTNLSWSQSILSKMKEKINLSLIIVIALTASFAIFAIYVDKATRLFKFEHLSFLQIMLAVLLGSFVALWFEFLKKLKFKLINN